MSIGLALSGGGAKGAAHIGVLQALKEENINIDYISGTSSGSIIASLYAIGYTPYNILNLFKTYCSSITDCDKMLPFKILGTIFTGKLSIKGFAKGDNLETIMKGACRVKNVSDISQVSLPIAIPTVDINTGEVIYFLNKVIPPKNDRTVFDDSPSYNYSGDIASIVRASCSLPGVFEPKAIGGHILVDGGVRMNSPVSILRQMGADKVITVSFDKNEKCKKGCNNILSIAMQSFDIMGHQVNEEELNSSDYIIRPNIGEVGVLDCGKTSQIATEGYNKTKESINEIKEILKNNN